ncbi:MAG: tetratricopeptide repeat protein, partial [Bacteroidota bacterium]
MIISPFSRVLRIFLWPVVIVFAWSGTTLAQTSPAERYQAVEKGWLAGDFEAIGAGWEADSSLYLAPAAPRPKNDQDVLLLAKLLRRIADTQQELARPDREALVWQTLLLWQADKTGPPDSLELEIRGQLLRFQALDEAFYNLPDTAALYFGVGSYHHRKAVYLAVMKAYNEGADDAVDSLLALAPAMATSTTYYDSIEQAFLQRMHGIQAMAATDYGAARRWFATALAQCPVSPGAYQPRSLLRLDLADAYRAAAVYDSAHWQLDTVAEELALLTPELLQLKGLYHLRRAMTYRSANQLRLAATSLQEADRHFAAYPLSRSYQADLMLTRSTLASVRRQRQDWQGAAEAYLRCIELAQARREPNSLQLLGLNLNYAGVQGLCGNFAGGLATAEQALQLSRERFGETHLYVAVALNTMAENLIGLGRFAEAEQYALQSLAIRKELYPPGHERLMYPNNVLARLLEEAGRPAEGLVYRRRVVDICTGKYGLTAANCREQRIDLVRGLVKADDPVRATEALRALNDDFPPDLPLSESDNPAFDIAQLYLQGLLGENILPGVSPFAPAIDRFNAVQFGFDAEEASILLAGEYGDVFRQQAMLDYQRVGPPVNRLKAWESVARLKYNALWRFRHERAVRNRLLPADLQERLGQQEQALVEAQGLRRASRRIPGQVASDSLARLVDRVSVLEADLSQLKDSIRRRFPDYTASRFELPQVDWSALQAKLEPSERIIEFFWADSLVIVFSYSDEGLEVMDFKLPDDGANAVDAYYTAVSTGKTDATPPAFLSEMTKYLKRLKEYDLTIITDGPLSRISWAGMPLPNDQFLIEAKSIKYA